MGIFKVIRVRGWRVVFVLAATVCSVEAAGQGTREVYIPAIFDAENGRIETSACIKAVERRYADGQWWANGSAGAGDPAMTAFGRVIAAMKGKDRTALLALSDPTSVVDRGQFDRQADAFFSQVEASQIASVPSSYDLGGVVTFYARFQLRDKLSFAPLSFSRNATGAVRFLPVRTNQVAVRLLDTWFVSQSGPSSTDQPKFCGDDTVRRATHRVALGSPSVTAGGPAAGLLLLRGASVDAPGPLAELVVRATAMTAALADLAGKANSEGIANLMTAQGAVGLRQWYPSATQLDRDRYFGSLRSMKPFFLFDAAPLIVVYARTDEGVQVLYFMSDANGKLLWTNSSHQSIGDEIFKKGALFAAATAERPFQALAISVR